MARSAATDAPGCARYQRTVCSTASLVAGVCWFPYAHANTLPKALGLDPYTIEFREQHRRAVVELLLARMPNS